VRTHRPSLGSPAAPPEDGPHGAASREHVRVAASGGSAQPDLWARRVSAAIAGGSREALGQLYEAKFDLLFLTARERTRRDESFALDCVQDAMMRVASSLPRLDSMASLDRWLRRVALTSALDRLRAESVQQAAIRAMVEEGRGGESCGSDRGASAEDRASPSPDHIGAIEEELAALAVMHPDDRGLLSLRFVRGLTLPQLARHLGLAPAAIDSRIRRLLARIRGRAAFAVPPADVESTGGPPAGAQKETP
jgi:RNA polymerase sigma factor (sigma-70 family)